MVSNDSIVSEVEFNLEDSLNFTILPVEFGEFLIDNNICVKSSLIESDEEFNKYLYRSIVKFTHSFVKSILNSDDGSLSITDDSLDYVLEMVLYNEDNFYMGLIGSMATGIKVSALNNKRSIANFDDVLFGTDVMNKMDVKQEVNGTGLNKVHLGIVDIILEILAEFRFRIRGEAVFELSKFAYSNCTVPDLIILVYDLMLFVESVNSGHRVVELNDIEYILNN